MQLDICAINYYLSKGVNELLKGRKMAFKVFLYTLIIKYFINMV